jgi:hypothetical protein
MVANPQSETQTAEYANVVFADLQFRKNEWGQLVLTMMDGTVHPGVEPVRCFPLSDPTRAIAIVDTDGHELVNLPALDVLNAASREIVQRELNDREFIPVILRIAATSAPNPPCRWDVETDRGATQFQLESEDDIRRQGSAGAVVADSNGIRYRIHDIRELDSHSQRIIRRLI